MRPEVQRFAALMEAVLKDNDHKGGWKSCKADWLLKRMAGEQWEVAYALDRYDVGTIAEKLTTEQRREIARECADVANFAMMIADVCGGLPKASP